MKAAIITITDGQNYGNRLQNYALQETLVSLGCQTETIRRRTSRDLSFTRRIYKTFKNIIKRILGKKTTNFSQIKRKKSFTSFNERLHFSEYVLHDNIASNEITDSYDYFICGSDQVWNARFPIIKEDIKNYLLSFAHPWQRISYAASFGTDNIAPGYDKMFVEELNKFHSLSVREESGVKIISKLCDRDDVEVVLDPTMLFTADEWLKIATKPDYIENNTKFIVTYILGNKNEELEEHIRKTAGAYDAIPINLSIEFLLDDQIENLEIYCTSPEEFVWLISHAECILTDSFHAAVFSIIFHKPFIVYQRMAVEKGNNMSSRIDTLLNITGIDGVVDNIQDPTLMPTEQCWEKVDQKINIEREKSLHYLKKALSVD